jgi:hypothetical protein
MVHVNQVFKEITMIRIARDCEKVVKVIDSCNTDDQFDTAINMAHCFSDKYELKAEYNEHLSPYADVINDSLDDKEEELLCQKENEQKIGFSV